MEYVAASLILMFGVLMLYIGLSNKISKKTN